MAKQSPAKAADEPIADLGDTAPPELVAEREEQERATSAGIQVPSDSSEAPAQATVRVNEPHPADRPVKAQNPKNFPISDPTPKAPVARQAKPFVFDEQNWHLTVNDKHGVFECDLMGMNPHVQMRLAATGLASLLRGRANKQKLLEGIMGGQFGGKRRQNYPATVVAYATMMGITVEDSYSQWQQLNNQEKMVIRQMPRIRIVLAEMAAAKEAHEGVDA